MNILTKYRLGDIAVLGSGSTPKSTVQEYYLGGDIPWVNSGELSDSYLTSPKKFITKLGFDNSSLRLYPKNTVLLAMYGATAGQASILCFEACTNQAICTIQPNPNILNPLYLKYKLDTMYGYLVGLSSGSARDNLSQIGISNLVLDLPSIEEQMKVVAILSSLDSKIAINRAINQNLEAMAKQLYDYWFVQFDFPNEEGRPYKSSGGKMVWNEKLKREIPKGWLVANIFDELFVQYGFPFSTEMFVEEENSVPVVRIRDILDNSVSAYSTEETDERYRLNKGDLLIGMDGNFHINYWNDDKAYLNQRSVRLRAQDNSTVSIVQAKYEITPYIKAKELRAKGSTVGHLSDKDLKELYVLVPSSKQMRIQLDALLCKIIANRNEIVELSKQRDELLPLLMNGQVSVG